MFGYVFVGAAQGEPALCGAPFCAVEVKAGGTLAARRSARQAARRLARRGIREAVFPEGYLFFPLFARCGVRPVPTAPLYRATAGAILRRALAQRGAKPPESTVALAAARVTAELAQTAWQIAPRVRYLALAVDGGGEALAYELRRELGVAARVYPRGAAPDATITLSFDGGAGLPRRGVVPLDSPALGVEYVMPEEIRAPGCDENGLLAALVRLGTLQPETLTVRRLWWEEQGSAAVRAGESDGIPPLTSE